MTPSHETRARELMGLVGALDLTDRRFEDCSQGERQRLVSGRRGRWAAAVVH